MNKMGKHRFRSVQGKIFLLTVGLVAATIISFGISGFFRIRSLEKITIESGEEQNRTIKEKSEASMKKVTEENMMRAVTLAGTVVDNELWTFQHDFTMLSEQVKDVFLHPDHYKELEVKPPAKENDGDYVMQMLYSETTDPDDPEMKMMAGKLANLEPLMAEILRGNGGVVMDCYIALPDGRTLVMDTLSAGKFDEDGNIKPYDPKTRPWYQGAVETGEMFFTPAVYSYFYDLTEIVWGLPVYVNGELVAVLEGSTALENLPEAFAQLEYGADGFSILVSDDRQLVYSPRTEGELAMEDQVSSDIGEKVNVEMNTMIDNAMDVRYGFAQVPLDGEDYYAAYAPIDTLGWTIIMFMPCDALLTDTLQLMEEVDHITEKTQEGYKGTFAGSSTRTLVVTVILLLAALILAQVFSRKLVKPINRMTNRVEKISGDNLSFEMEPAYRTGDEIEILAMAFSNLSERTRNYIEWITEITAEKERLGTELSVAAQIQEDMLPMTFPLFPEKQEFLVHASMDPAKEVGGDFYDIFLVDEDHLALVMADVSGKGIPASLFMIISKTLIKNRALMGGTPAEILYDVNNRLCDGNKAGMFVTVWLAIVTLSTGEVVEANGGHENPFLLQTEEGEDPGVYAELKRPHNFVLGAMKDMKYSDDSFVMKPGDRLFIYTDGAPEATNKDNELYGMERLGSTLNQNRDVEPKEVLSEVRKDIDIFVGDADQFDDLTMLSFVYNGESGSGKKLTLTVPAVKESHEDVRTFVNDELERTECEIKIRREINMAVDEIFTNIVDYGYTEKEPGEVTVILRYISGTKGVELIFTDDGMPYDPLVEKAPDTNLPAKERKVGGLGIFLVKKLMDEVDYEFRDGKNVLTIRKNM